jgi:flagellar basal body-associated protein FliL
VLNEENEVNKMVLIGAVVGALLLGGGGTAFYITPMASLVTQEAQVDTRTNIYVEVPPVVANFEYEGIMRYLRETVNLQTLSTASATMMKENAPLIQGEILMLLQDLDFGTVRSTEGKRALIETIDVGIREFFQSGAEPLELEQVVLTGFVVK